MELCLCFYIFLLAIKNCLAKEKITVEIKTWHDKTFNPLAYPGIDKFVLEFARVYLKPISINDRKVIVNLNEYLPFVKQSNCLVLVDSFQQAIAQDIAYPIIRRKMEFAFIRRSDTRWTLIGHVLSGTNDINKTLATTPCKNSQFYLGSATHSVRGAKQIYANDHCVRLKTFKFASATKPWNCQIHFSLLPVLYQKSKINIGYEGLPLIHGFETVTKNSQYIAPSTIPEIHMIVTAETSLQAQERLVEEKWVFASTTRRGQYKMYSAPMLYHNIIFVLLAKNGIQHILLYKQLYIYKMDLVCSHCKLFFCGENTTSMANGISTPKYCTKRRRIALPSLESIDKVESISFVAFSEQSQTYWDLSELGKLIGLSVFQTTIESCKVNTQSNLKQHLLLPLDSSRSKLAHVSVRVLTEFILKNYSYSITGRQVCENGKIVRYNDGIYDLEHWTNEFYHLQVTESFLNEFLHFSNFPDSLVFLACGSIGVNAYPFKEFINVFQPAVWLFTLVSSIATIWTFAIVAHRTTFNLSIWTCYIECMIRCFLNQDGECPSPVLRQNAGRFVLAGLGLAVTVMSNAYKNDNCYRMTIPRQHTPIWYLQRQLFANNFTLFSLIQEMFSDEYLNLDEAVSLQKFKWHTTQQWLLGESNTTEIVLVSDITRSRSGSTRDAQIFRSDLDRIAGLHSGILTSIKTLANSLASVKVTVGYLVDWLKMESRRLVMKELLNCRNVAIIASYNELPKLAKNLSRSANISEYLHVGAELYFHSFITHVFRGSPPVHILKRIRRFNETGVLDWWVQSINESSRFVPNNKITLTPPNLSGNILVIFLVQFSGLAISTIFLAVEITKYLAFNDFLKLPRKLIVTAKGLFQRSRNKFMKFQGRVKV